MRTAIEVAEMLLFLYKEEFRGKKSGRYRIDREDGESLLPSQFKS